MEGRSSRLSVTENKKGGESMYQDTVTILEPEKQLFVHILVFSDEDDHRHKSQCKSNIKIVHHHGFHKGI